MGRWANEGREAERITPTNTYSSPFTHTHTKVHNYPQHTDEDYQQEGPAPSAQLLNASGLTKRKKIRNEQQKNSSSVRWLIYSK